MISPSTASPPFRASRLRATTPRRARGVPDGERPQSSSLPSVGAGPGHERAPVREEVARSGDEFGGHPDRAVAVGGHRRVIAPARPAEQIRRESVLRSSAFGDDVDGFAPSGQTAALGNWPTPATVKTISTLPAAFTPTAGEVRKVLGWPAT